MAIPGLVKPRCWCSRDFSATARLSPALWLSRRQGADFVHLNRHHGVRVQTGGSDQWGNIVAGALFQTAWHRDVHALQQRMPAARGVLMRHHPSIKHLLRTLMQKPDMTAVARADAAAAPGRHGPDPEGGGQRGGRGAVLRRHLPAAAQGRRPQVRQVRGGRRLACSRCVRMTSPRLFVHCGDCSMVHSSATKLHAAQQPSREHDRTRAATLLVWTLAVVSRAWTALELCARVGMQAEKHMLKVSSAPDCACTYITASDNTHIDAQTSCRRSSSTSTS